MVRNLGRTGLGLVALIAFVSLATPAAARESREENEAIDLATRMDMYLGAPLELGIGEASSPAMAGRFSPAAGRQVWTGRAAPATWLRFSISGAELEAIVAAGRGERPSPAVQWILVLEPSFSIILDRAELYIPLRSGGFQRIAAGAMVPRRPFEAPSRHFVFELPADAFDGSPCYLRISSSRDVEARLFLEPALERNEGREYAVYGIIYGVLIAMIIYGLFLLVSLKDRAYHSYILYTLSLGLWIFFVQGHAKAVFGPHPGFDRAMLWFASGSFIAWGALFSASFLELRKAKPALYTVFIIVSIVGMAAAAAGLAGWEDLSFALSHYLGIALPVLIIVAAAARMADGFPAARYFLVGWSLMAAAGLAFALMGLKVLPVSFITVNCMGAGAAAQSIFLALALSDRFSRLETERRRLERSQAQYRELSLTDVLTGLRNKRCLSIELSEAMGRSRSGGSPLALIFLDIDDFKAVNDSYGHALGDEVLAALARSIRSCVRDDDIPCRYGGEEFIIVMPDTRADDALRVAERIRENFAATGTRLVEGESVKTTVSLGVTEFLAGESSEAFITRADDAMYEAKRAGKNRSVVRRV
jgi:diguanylate cyclase (GGDEF)-like protein